MNWGTKQILKPSNICIEWYLLFLSLFSFYPVQFCDKHSVLNGGKSLYFVDGFWNFMWDVFVLLKEHEMWESMKA